MLNFLTVNLVSTVSRKHGVKWWGDFHFNFAISRRCCHVSLLVFIQIYSEHCKQGPLHWPSVLCPGVQYLYRIVCRNQVQDTSVYKVMCDIAAEIGYPTHAMFYSAT